MTALQRAEIRHFKWKIDENLHRDGYATFLVGDPEVQEALCKFYLQEGFEVKTFGDGQRRISPIGWQPDQSDFNLNSL